MSTLAIISGSLEKIATEIRALQKTEFSEAMEPFSKPKGFFCDASQKKPPSFVNEFLAWQE